VNQFVVSLVTFITTGCFCQGLQPQALFLDTQEREARVDSNVQVRHLNGEPVMAKGLEES
jgi:hypothetical protein